MKSSLLFSDSGQKECLMAGYEKSVKADQGQEEELLLLNIHVWKIMSHCKEILVVHQFQQLKKAFLLEGLTLQHFIT